MKPCKDAVLVVIHVLAFVAAVFHLPAWALDAANQGVVPSQSIASGFQHTCAISDTGAVKCWGSNQFGELGDGTFLSRGVPSTVQGFDEPVISVTAGTLHTCAVTLSGSVKCWGSNSSGQLGNNTTNSSAIAVEPVGLPGSIVSITAGRAHTCALTSTSELYCWGWNTSGQLGDQTTIQRLAPVHVLSGLSSVSAGRDHTCATTASGMAVCWGRGDRGQLGNVDFSQSSYPVEVTGLSSGVAAITSGYNHSCALTTAGQVKCWGGNEYGQLGDSTTIDRPTQVDVTSMASGVSAVDAGSYHTCAVQQGTVKCWGFNNTGRLGDGGRNDSLIPVAAVNQPMGVEHIDAGGTQSCVIANGGQFWCWGNNAYGQIGIGSLGSFNNPVDVSSLDAGTSSIGLGYQHACAVKNGAVYCWGGNPQGQLGDGTHDEHLTPAPVSGLSSESTSLSVAADHSCALALGGNARCWGANTRGQLGDGTQTARAAPVDVIGLGSDVRQIATANAHSCALTATGGVKCWGSNDTGTLGNGTTVSHLVPADVTGLASGVAMISVGSYHSCALLDTGGVKCWGSLDSGSGSGPYLEPVDVPGLASNVTSIASGGNFDCASIDGSALKCWGSNYNGNLGNGTTDNSPLNPVDVVGFNDGVLSVAAAGAHACAVNGSGTAKCWGLNDIGQLGDGSQELMRLLPTNVVGLQSGISAISAGYFGGCAITEAGLAKCWGENVFGQLGNGTTGSVLEPELVLFDEVVFRAGFE
ncbi:RCC1 domain-containing protein [Dokdonella sp.]|uniref:RCC1 domain-containing protein n=1 Tax=Dokdonella sp. TaxID=2291710 RepID=UPI003529062A